MMYEPWSVCLKCGKPSDAYHVCNDCLRSTVEELVGREQADQDTRVFAETDATTHYQQRIASLETTMLEQADQIGGLTSELGKLRDAVVAESDDVKQCLGQALGYPWYKDDLKNFPNATEQDGVCVGDHTAVSLAGEAAETIVNLRDALAEQREITAGWQDAAQMSQVLTNLRRAEAAQQQLAASQAEAAALRQACQLAKVALEHSVPGDCWSTGPLTGNDYLDFVVCPGCRAMKAIDDTLATPSAAAERMQALEEVAKWAKANDDAKTARTNYMLLHGNAPGEMLAKIFEAAGKLRAALTALDAATDRNPRTVEEVKGE